MWVVTADLLLLDPVAATSARVRGWMVRGWMVRGWVVRPRGAAGRFPPPPYGGVARPARLGVQGSPPGLSHSDAERSAAPLTGRPAVLRRGPPGRAAAG